MQLLSLGVAAENGKDVVVLASCMAASSGTGSSGAAENAKVVAPGSSAVSSPGAAPEGHPAHQRPSSSLR